MLHIFKLSLSDLNDRNISPQKAQRNFMVRSILNDFYIDAMRSVVSAKTARVLLEFDKRTDNQLTFLFVNF